MAERALILSFAFALAAGCASTSKATSGGGGPSAEDYSPLAIGSSWTYEAEFQGQKGERTVKLVSEKDGYYLFDDNSGAWKHTPDGLRDKDRFLIKHPIEVGTKWKAVTGPSAVEHSEIVSVGEPCQSAAGPFSDCLVVAGMIRADERTTMHIRWTWAKDIGLVKVETEVELVGKGRVPQTKQSLLRYAVPGGGVKGAPGAEKGDAAKKDDEEPAGGWTKD